MKNIKYAVVALLGLTVFSCQDAIDIVQPGELYLETTFKTVNDLQLGLNGVYPAIGIDTEISHGSIWTDECRIGVANSSQGLSDGRYGFQLNTLTGAASSIWQSNYTLINFANRLLKASEVVTVKPEEETLYKDIVAQAHILRAWGHFKLLAYYSEDMTDDTKLGVILMDHVPSISETHTRSTNGEVFALIDEDLAYVDDLTTNVANDNRFYVSPDFVKAFKARMALYREDYATASQLAQELIGTYPLTPRNQYTKIWSDSATLDLSEDEVIFKLQRLPGDGTIGSIWGTNNSSETGALIFEMSTNLYSYFISNPSDVRGSAFIYQPEPDPNVYPIGKYRGTPSIPMLNHAKIFRTSEMYFIKAEAQAAAGSYSGVQATLQAINNARFSTTKLIPNLATAEAAWAEILNQRSIELCYEGHRYLDLKRLLKKANMDLVRNPSDCAVNGECFLSRDSYKWVFPIPQTELQANPSIRSQQNPGY